MPELPEVENLRMGLEKHILGQKILNVKVSKPKLVSGSGTLRTASSKKVKEFVLPKTEHRKPNTIQASNSLTACISSCAIGSGCVPFMNSVFVESMPSA